MKTIYAKTLLSAALFGAIATNALAVQQVSISIPVNGKTRTMKVFTPNEVTDNMPLFIITHGMNQDPGYQSSSDKIYTLCDTEKFIAVYPASDGNMWDTSGDKDINFITKTIAEMYARYNIDPHRVYWSGFSMGSMLIYHSIHKMQGKIAAFAPTSGIQFSEQPWNKCQKPVNLIHCHAWGDDVFPYEQYSVQEYVESMAKMNEKLLDETATVNVDENYKTKNGLTGVRTEWSFTTGHKVVRFMYDNGGHWPNEGNKKEIWEFVKQYSLADEDLDPVEEPAGNASYVIDESSEVFGDADKLNNKTLIPSNVDCNTIWYMDADAESPQNVCVGDFSNIANHPYCWFKFHKVTNANCTTEGNLYTIQMADQYGSNYTLWGSDGYFNTPPTTFCFFALGLNNQYGQDQENFGLWKVDYEEGQGYTIQNVGALEAGVDSWAWLPNALPSADQGYVRLFSKIKKNETGIDAISTVAASGILYNLQGKAIVTPVKGELYICNGKKQIIK